MYHEMNVWSEGSPARLQKYTRQYLAVYKILHDEAISERYWALYPKHHLLLHVVEDTEHNPKLLWNYGDEERPPRKRRRSQLILKQPLG